MPTGSRRAPIPARVPTRWGLGILTAAAILTNTAYQGDSLLVTAVNDLAQLVVAAGAGLAGLVVGRRASGRERTAWTLVGVGSCWWAVGQGVWAFFELVLRTEPPSPGICDLFFLAAAPWWIVGLVWFVEPPAGLRSQLRAAVEGVLLAGGTFLPAWLAVLGPVSRDTEGSAFEQVVYLAYPVLDVLAISAAVYALTRRRHQEHGRLAVVGAGVLAIGVADVGFWYQSSVGSYSGANLLDNGWIVGFLLMAVGATWPPGRRRGAPSAGAFVGRWWLLCGPDLVFAAGVAVSVAMVSGGPGASRAWEIPALVALVVVGGIHGVVVISELHRVTSGLEQRVTERTGELRRREEYFAALVRSSSDVVMVVGDDGTIRWASDSLTAVYGFDPAALVGRAIDAVEPFTSLTGPLASASGRHEWQLTDASGRPRWAESTVTDLRHVPAVGCLVVNTRDVTERVELTTQLRHQAFHDTLTELPNRALFGDRVTHALARSETTGATLAVVLVDLDGFKNVNDSHGHHAGDRVLRRVAASLRHRLDERHTVARLGGDEFAVLLDGLADREAARPLVDAVVSALQTTVELESSQCETRGSVGVAFADPGAGTSVERLIRNADIAMYEAKRRRDGGAVVFTPQMHHAAQDRFEIENELRDALAARQLVLHYQPTYSVADGRIEGFEALVRWDHPSRGLVPPAQFIPIAEESGLIVPLGEWVVHTAVDQLREWGRSFSDRGALTMSINLSVGQLGSDDVVDHLVQVVADADIDPTRIVFEITESMLISDVENVSRRLQRIADAGIRIAIDDFGTGYASLANLQRLPLDILKIDRQFVRSDHGPDHRKLLASIVGIGQTLGLATVAEGIENHHEFDVLRDQGCDLAQGFYLSRPLTPTAVRRLLERQYGRVPIEVEGALDRT